MPPTNPGKKAMSLRHAHLRRIAALSTVLAVAVAAGIAAPAQAATSGLGERLARAVTGPDTYRHLQAFQRIADANGGNRAVGTPGTGASEAYVLRTLTAAGYHPVTQDVPYTRFAVSAEHTSVVTPAKTLRTLLMDESPSLRGASAPIVRGPETGCQAGDYDGLDVRGAVVLLARASCGYTQQVMVAGQVGARAVVLYLVTPSPDDVWRLHWFGTSPPPIPLASIPQSQAEWMAEQLAEHPLTLRLDWQGEDVRGVTHNVIAETRGGSRDQVVVSGAHLDSVSDGPGLNDNGSSAAALLQIAVELAPLQYAVRNQVRFVWWGAEELVDVGSDYYVAHLTAGQKQAILVYFNGEMIASPNFVRFVMRGPGVLSEPFAEYYTAHHLAFELVGSDAVGSDHEPFAAAGITVGGILGGAMGVKTAAEAATYGGTAGQMYDPCYHQPCDTLANLNQVALDQGARAMAYAVGWAADGTGRSPR
jgi:peptidase M28-like protein/PA domain-containing protein